MFRYFLVGNLLLFAMVYFHPDLDVYVAHVKEKCCSFARIPSGKCSLMDNNCVSDLKYLARRCGNDWFTVYEKCLSENNNTVYCALSTAPKLEEIIQKCYFHY